MGLTTTTLSSTNDILSRYMQEIRKYPMLSFEEEHALAKSVVEHQDINAAHKLVTSHLQLVVKIAFTMRGYGLSLMDLISEGNIGLMHAVKKFNPELGHRLSTYAIWWIRSTMSEFIMKSWSPVKIGTTVAQKKLFFNLRKIKQKINNFHARSNSSLTNEDIVMIANQLNVSQQEVREMDCRLTGGDHSLDAPMYNSEGGSSTMLDHISENRANQETMLSHMQESSIRNVILKQAISSLNERERNIISARHLQEKPDTLDVVSKKYRISCERVRQIESRALQKLKEYVKTYSNTEKR